MRWNNVTQLSRVIAALVFLAVLPILSFYIGRQYERTLLDISHVEELAASAARMYYTSKEYRIRVELPAVWQSYDVVEAKNEASWYRTLLTPVRILQFYTPTSDPAYQSGDPAVAAEIVSPADWAERKAGKAMVFELLIFPKEDWQRVHETLAGENAADSVFAHRVVHSFAGEEYAYIFLGRDEYPSDIQEYLFMPTARDIRVLRVVEKENP